MPEQSQVIDESYLTELDRQKAKEHMQDEEWYEALALWKKIAVSVRSTEEQEVARQNIIRCREEIAKSPQKENTAGSIEFKVPSATLKQVIGLKRQKQMLSKLIELPLHNPEGFERMDLRTGAGIVLYGAPGTGKTYLARAVAGEHKLPMADVHVGEVLSKWVGEAEKKLSEIFTLARRKQPCILFFDEIDALAMSRDNAGAEGTGAELRSSVTEFLKQMSELHDDPKSRVFVVGATNQPWNMDIAMKRSGRFSFVIYVRAPIFTERMGMLQHYIKKDIRKRISWIKLALATTDYSPADIEKIVDVAKHNAVQEGRLRIGTRDIQRVLKDRDYGKSSLDDWMEVIRAEYLGDKHRKVVKRWLWLIPTKWEDAGKEGKFTRADKKIYRELVGDVKRHFANWQAIKLARWLGRNI